VRTRTASHLDGSSAFHAKRARDRTST